MHHDAIHYFPLPLGVAGMDPWTAETVVKSQAVHGVSVVEVVWTEGRWRLDLGSALVRRITARTPMRISGPAAGHALLRTAFDPDGRIVLGTFNSCGNATDQQLSAGVADRGDFLERGVRRGVRRARRPPAA